MSYFIQTIPILIALVVIEKGIVIFDRNIIKKKYGFSLVEKYRGVFKKNKLYSSSFDNSNCYIYKVLENIIDKGCN